MRHGHAARGRRGLTLLEALVAAAVATLLVGAVVRAMLSSSDFRRSSAAAMDLEVRVRRTVARLAQEVLTTGEAGIATDLSLGSDELAYQVAAGAAGAAIQWGEARRLELELEPGETDDGTDEDGDGLVDERRVVLVRAPGTPGERRTVLCNGVAELLEGETANGLDDNGNGLVDEAGLCFSSEGDLITVRLTLERAGDREVVRRTLETAVRTRN